MSFLFLLYVSGHSKQKIFFKFFLTDRKISSPNHVVYWWRNFSISQKNFEKIFFAWNVLKHKVKPKNSRNSTFFQKLKFPPYFWKTLVKFSSPKCSLWYAVIFLSPREGKFKQKNNQLFQLAEERRKDRGFSLSDGWPVSPVSAILRKCHQISQSSSGYFKEQGKRRFPIDRLP